MELHWVTLTDTIENNTSTLIPGQLLLKRKKKNNGNKKYNKLQYSLSESHRIQISFNAQLTNCQMNFGNMNQFIYDCIRKNMPRKFDLSLIILIQSSPRTSSPQGLS